MPIFLVIFSFLSCLTLFYRSNPSSLRHSFIKASVLHGVLITIITELLSSGKNITSATITLTWMGLAIVQTLWILVTFKNSANNEIVEIIKDLPQKWSNQIRQLGHLDRFILIGIAAIFSICGFTAFLAAPNNGDAMSYHMPRIMHWIQNQSVEYYPTNNLKQLSFPPGSGYILMHLHLLVGDDRFFNLLQWSAFLGCTLVLSQISLLLFGPGSQILTALAGATLPMAIMQSSTTQNDLLVAFWLVCAVCFTLQPSSTRARSLWVGLALALAVITKPTGILFGFPILIWNAIQVWQKTRLRSIHWINALTISLLAISTSSACIISMSLPHWSRNIQVFNSFLGYDSGTRNATLSPVGSLSNLLRNISLNLPLEQVWQSVVDIHQALAWNIADRATTFGNNLFLPKQAWRYLLPDEDYVGSPIHFLLLGLTIVVIFSRALSKKMPPLDRPENWNRSIYLLSSILFSFLLVCSLLKWQIWMNRLLLPLFFLAMPLTAYYVIAQCSKPLRASLSIVLITVSLGYSLTTIHHPLIAIPSNFSVPSQAQSILTTPREDRYLNSTGKNLNTDLKAIAQGIASSGCSSIAIVAGENSIEYPFWVFLKNYMGNRPFRVKSVQVQGPARLLPEEFTEEPCFLLNM
jgi:4-amino-4-deoxy-L-arabinose transferase-like glycosyltransferase